MGAAVENLEFDRRPFPGHTYPLSTSCEEVQVDGVAHGFVAGVAGVEVVAGVVGGRGTCRGGQGRGWLCRSR